MYCKKRRNSHTQKRKRILKMNPDNEQWVYLTDEAEDFFFNCNILIFFIYTAPPASELKLKGTSRLREVVNEKKCETISTHWRRRLLSFI